MDRAKLDSIIELVNRLLHPAGYDCLEVEWVSGERILRLFVDTLPGAAQPVVSSEPATPPTVGITIDGCAAASRLLAEYPDMDEKIPGSYTLEVSSPGVERPLRQRAHFERALGETIQVKLRDKVQERRNGKGRLIQVVGPGESGPDETLITLETDQGAWCFPLTSLQRASLVYDWGDG